jgi:[protein-PII] uridylyltransferase
MSKIAQKSDLSDPQVIAAFAKKVGNERQLTALYLLTVADIRGTSPKVWNAWKSKLLEDLYRAHHPCPGRLGARSARPCRGPQARGTGRTGLRTQPFEAHKPLWDTLDVGYFMRHDAADIAWHTRQLSRLVGSSQPDRARPPLAGR